MKAMIFGAGGQDGYYLSQLCQAKGINVVGIDSFGNYIHADVADYNIVSQLIKTHAPDYLFHLAAKSTTQHDALFENHQTISTGTLNILEAVRLYSPHSKIFITGSGLQFKNNGNPISETDAFEASSPYAIARIQAVYASRYYRSLGLKVYNGYLFHHESPLRPNNHVSQMIALTVKKIMHGHNEIIELGDISVEKEWSFAGDIVHGIWMLMQQDIVFEAVIGSGKTYSIENWLHCCFALINKNWKDFVTTKSNFVVEYKKLVSNPQTMFSLGWTPHTTFSQLAEMMILGKTNEQHAAKKKNLTWPTSCTGRLSLCNNSSTPDKA